jgi:hypothetical protein
MMTELESVRSDLNRIICGTHVRALMRNIDLIFLFFRPYTTAEKLNRIEFNYLFFTVLIFLPSICVWNGGC